MRRTKKLHDLHKAVRRRCLRLRGILSRAGTSDHADDTEARIAFVTIELRNTWANFIRSYYVSCMLSAFTTYGTKVHCSTRRLDENAAIGRAVRRWRSRAQPKTDGSWQRRDEPAWHDPDQFIPICQNEGFSNLADVEAALSTGDRTFKDLPVFRNYFGHRAYRTERAARDRAPSYGISATKRPSEILLSRPLGRPQPLILEWMDHILFTTEFLCA